MTAISATHFCAELWQSEPSLKDRYNAKKKTPQKNPLRFITTQKGTVFSPAPKRKVCGKNRAQV